MKKGKALRVILAKAAKGQLDSETANAIFSGRVKAQEAAYTLRFNNVGDTGIKEYLNETTTKQQGISDFHQGYLPKGRNFVCTGIRLAATNHATINDPKKMADYSTVTSNWDPALYGGKLVVTQNDKVVIELPCHVLGTPAAAASNVGAEDAFELENPVTFEEGKKLKVWIEYADGETVDINSQAFGEITFFGMETRSR